MTARWRHAVLMVRVKGRVMDLPGVCVTQGTLVTDVKPKCQLVYQNLVEMVENAKGRTTAKVSYATAPWTGMERHVKMASTLVVILRFHRLLFNDFYYIFWRSLQLSRGVNQSDKDNAMTCTWNNQNCLI